MVKIRLTNGYFIEVEGVEHTLKRMSMSQPKDKNKPPKEVIKDIGYFPTLKSAIKRYLALIQSEELDSLSLTTEEYVAKIESINEETINRISDLLD